MNRVIIFGSRNWVPAAIIVGRIFGLPSDWIIVHGACPTGADAIADGAARLYGRTVETYPADRNKYGRGAGPRRSGIMAALPDVVLGIGFRSPGESRGTDGMRTLLEFRGVPVERYGSGWAP